jgi:hypothetical protein
MSISEAATMYHQAGWTPVPVSASCKVPLIKWGKGAEHLPSTPEQTADLFVRMQARHGRVMIGIALPGDVVVLDIDHRPKRGWIASSIMADLKSKLSLNGNLPKMLTPSGGRHLWLRLPDGAETRNWTSGHGHFPIKGVDIRTKGGLAIVPPSVRADSSAYCWIGNARELPVASPDLVQAFKPAQPPEVSKPLPHDPVKCSRYVETAYSREIAAVRLAGKGGRNSQLFKSAASLGSLIAVGALPADHVRHSLVEAAKASGLVKEDGLASVNATIESGLRTGMANPRKLPGGLS